MSEFNAIALTNANANAMSWEVRVRRGHARIHSPRRGMVLAKFRGQCSSEHVGAVTRLLDQWIDEGLEVVVAVDTSDLAKALPGFRNTWSQWLRDNDAHVRQVEVLRAHARPRVAGRVRRHGSALSFEVAVADAAV